MDSAQLTDLQPHLCIAAINSPGSPLSALSGIHLRIMFISDWPVTLAHLHKYLCQKLITTEVQIGAVSQLSWTSLMKPASSLLQLSPADLNTARAAVVKLQLD